MQKRVVTLAFMCLALPAQAVELSVKVEPGVSAPLTDPQSDLFKLGGAGSISALLGLTPFLDVGPIVAFNLSPSASSGAEAGTAWAFGGGLRLKASHQEAGPSRRFLGVSPWLDGDALFVRTGDLNRPGFAVGAGLAFPLDRAGVTWLGPFARYVQIIQGERMGYDNRDSRTIIVGLSLEIGGMVEHEPPPAEVVAPPPVVEPPPVVAEAPPPVAEPAPVAPPPDRDSDGIPDATDHCPDVAGTVENLGCPPYKNLVIKADKIEIKQKVFFDFNKATVKPISFPLLNEVAQALQDNKGFRVQVQGHADSVGSDRRNQALSERRAAAVLDYLVAHGVARDRLESKGFSSSVPIDTNETAKGRENNRRVEFIILNDGSSK